MSNTNQEVRYKVTLILHCNECDSELAAMPGGGYYCTTCNYPPSLQDVYLTYRCPEDGTKLTKQHTGINELDNDTWCCATCNKLYFS